MEKEWRLFGQSHSSVVDSSNLDLVLPCTALRIFSICCLNESGVDFCFVGSAALRSCEPFLICSNKPPWAFPVTTCCTLRRITPPAIWSKNPGRCTELGGGGGSGDCAGVTGGVTGGVSGMGNGVMTGLVKGYTNPFTSESYSLQDGDYDPYNFIGGQ